jgi:hypothetical protein
MNQNAAIDTYSHPFEVTETRVVLVDADPGAVLGAAERIDLGRTVAQAIEALGVGDRLALPPARLEAGSGREHVYGMALRVDGGPAERVNPHQLRAFDRPGYVKVIWDVRVEAGGETGTLLSTTTRFVSTDHESHERLEAAWGVLGMASVALSKRALAAIKRSAEDREERSCFDPLEGSLSRQESRFALAA